MIASNTFRRLVHAAIAAMALAWSCAALVGGALAGSAPVFTGIVKGVAVGGYDPVAYFSAGKPVKGDPAITMEHQGAEWRFASEANRAAFRADPAKYAPQFGGYCAWAVSQGYTAKGDPNAWSIVGGKLYLNYDKRVQSSWEKNAQSLISKGEANWPRVLAK
ncbi:MAG: YHS domain-containing (seleno)protein [Hyphomicrobiaceae bacterium]|nr:YHS domain-containing (seleno)protein [Hyphomicrobiaceae bacterium]